MAKATKPAAAPAAKSANALVPWDEQLAREAEIAAGLEANTGGGQYFSVRGGILQFNDAPIPGNAIGVIVVDTLFENVFYEGKYDPTTPTPPTCFAFAEEEGDLAPHETVVAKEQAQHEECVGCPMNAWGTADQGRGKACRNTRRLGLLPAGTVDPASGRFTAFPDVEHFTKAAMGILKLPVTSVKGWAAHVKQVAGALKRPPHGIFTKISVVPDAKTQFKVLFEPIAKVPDNLMAAVMARRAEMKLVINQPYSLDVEEAPAKPAARGRAAASPVAARPAVKKSGKKY